MNETSIGICAKNCVFPSLSVYAPLSPLYVTLYLALPPILSNLSARLAEPITFLLHER